MEKNRLRWAVRRGMLELDLVLSPFLEHHYDALPPENRELFRQLLEEQDQDLFNWFIHRQQPPTAELQKIVSLIRRKMVSD